MKKYFVLILSSLLTISCSQKIEKSPYAPINNLDTVNNSSVLSYYQDSIIWYTDLNDVPADPDSVFYLSLREKGYNKFPVEIFKFKNLKSLDISLHNIRTIPDKISHLSQLESLTMAYGHLKSIPISIGKLKKLKELNFLYNDIKILPKSIGELNELKQLNMTGNPIADLPETLFNLQGLNYLILRQPGKVSLFPVSKQEIIKQRLPNCIVAFQ